MSAGTRHDLNGKIWQPITPLDPAEFASSPDAHCGREEERVMHHKPPSAEAGRRLAALLAMAALLGCHPHEVYCQKDAGECPAGYVCDPSWGCVFPCATVQDCIDHQGRCYAQACVRGLVDTVCTCGGME
jgi:hypothetical protein